MTLSESVRQFEEALHRADAALDAAHEAGLECRADDAEMCFAVVAQAAAEMRRFGGIAVRLAQEVPQ